MVTQTGYSLFRRVALPYDEALRRTKDALKDEEGEESVVAAFDPEAALGITGNPTLGEIAREAKERLTRVLDRV